MGALPPIFQRLFADNGYGSLLRRDIIDKSGLWQDMFLWSGETDYQSLRMVFGSDNRLYLCGEPSGPGTEAGAKDPVDPGNAAYWGAAALAGDVTVGGRIIADRGAIIAAGYCNGDTAGGWSFGLAAKEKVSTGFFKLHINNPTHKSLSIVASSHLSQRIVNPTNARTGDPYDYIEVRVFYNGALHDSSFQFVVF